MKATIGTLALIRAADQSAIDAAKSGVKAVIALVRENIGEKFPHGAAVELASILKDGKVSQHSAKRYADLTVMACKAITHQSNLAASKVKTKKEAVKDASIEASLATLADMVSMSKVREWAKENGPKAKEKTTAADAPAADAPAADAPTAPNLEALGQLREIRECLAMVNSGQITAGEALATIATIAGIQLASVPKAPAGKAGSKGKANKTLPQAV